MENKKLITADNWTFTGFKSLELLAFIHLGAEPRGDESALLYLVTVLKNLEEELFQLEYPTLAEAIDAINQRYHHWEFVDRGSRLDDGGCGSCAAH